MAAVREVAALKGWIWRGGFLCGEAWLQLLLCYFVG